MSLPPSLTTVTTFLPLSSPRHNNKYGKALDRRAKLHKKQAQALGGGEGQVEDRIRHLKQVMAAGGGKESL